MTHFDLVSLTSLTSASMTNNGFRLLYLPEQETLEFVISVIASSAFLSSVYCTKLLQNELLSRITFDVRDYEISLLNWSTTHHSVQPPVGNLATKQRSCDQTTVEKTQSSLLTSQTTHYHWACLRAASTPQSGDWLHALPISSCGPRLDDEILRVAVGFRLESN